MGGNKEQESSFQAFRNFIDEMEMRDIKYIGDTYT